MNTTQDPLLTREEVADRLRVCVQTLSSWAMQAKNLPVVKIGEHAVRYRTSDVEELIQARTRPVAGISSEPAAHDET